MSTITLEIAEDVAAALALRSHEANTSVQALSAAVLEQWLFDQGNTDPEPWLPEDIAAIEKGLAEAHAGLTVSHSDFCAQMLAKAR